MIKKLIKIIVLAFIITVAPLIVLHVEATEGDTFTITFHSNSGTGPEHEGTFEGGGTTNAVTYEALEVPAVAYSHTANVDDTGLQTSNYGNSWTNSNIRGTGRTSASSQAHVITIDGADHLMVELYYNGESASYDWVSVWEGSHPTYTAASNTASEGYVTVKHGATISTNKFGGSGSGSYTVNGNPLTSMAHQTLTVPGDTVTFAFKSDSSGYGNGYGYYAIVSQKTNTLSGTYEEPKATNPDHRFSHWSANPDGSGTAVDINSITSDAVLYAVYEENLIGSGVYGCAWKLWGNGTLEIGTEGQTCTLNSTTNESSWPWYSNRTKVKSVEFKGTVNAGAKLPWMFYNQSNLTDINFTGFHTNNATNMDSMFSGCSKLTELDLSSLDTTNVTSMYSMFAGCSALTDLNLSGFDTSKVTDMNGMFYNCSSLTDLNLSNFDTSNVTNTRSMFSGCSKLTSLDLSSFDTSNVTSMTSMFYKCQKLKTIDLSSFDTSKVTGMNGMFYNCSSLTELDLSGFDTSKVSDMSSMFAACSSLTLLDLDGFSSSNVTTMNGMFSGCRALASLDLSSFDTSNVLNMGEMFYNCRALATLNLSSFNTSKVTEMTNMFQNCSHITSLDLSGFDTSKVTKMNNMFSTMSALKTIYLPQTFAFNGKGTITGASRAFLNSSSSTRKWHRAYDDKTLSKVNDNTLYTAQQLTDSWNPSMAGLWVWEGETLDTLGVGDENKQSSKASGWNQLSETVWKYVFNIFDAEQDYYLTEDPIDGFVSDIPVNQGYILVENGEATVTNKSLTQTGSLTIMKNVNGPVTDEKFAFDIELTGTGVPSGMRAIDGVIFNDGKARIYLADGESKTISGLREGIAYTVEEETPSNYDMTATDNTGYITADGQIAIFTNNYHSFVPAQPPVSFIIRKQVDALDYNQDTEYTFHAYFEELDPTAVCTYQITGSASQNFTADSDGTKVIQFKLKKDQQIVFADIPSGTKYQISEAAGDYRSSYTISDDNSLGKIAKNTAENSLKNTALSTALEAADSGELINIIFTNIFEDFEDIVITKNVPDNASDETEFEFTVTFSSMKPNASFNSDIGRIVADDEGNAEKTFYLKNGQVIRFEQVPVGTMYRFTESKSSYIASYTVSDSRNQNKITPASGANTQTKKALSTALERVDKGEDITVTFTNEVERRNLTVVVRTDGNIDDPNKLFHFTVQARDESNPVSGEFDVIYTHANGSTENIKLSFNGAGRTEFDLKKDEYVKILGLPKGISYIVRQNEYTSEGIATSYNTQDERHNTAVGDLDETEFEDGYVVTGILNEDKTEILANAVANRTITLSKTVSGNMGNKNDRFTFLLLRNDGQDFDPSKVVIEAYKTSNRSETVPAASLAVSYSGDIIQLSLGHDETVLITTDANISYTISESDYSSNGYRTFLNNSVTQSRTMTFTLDSDRTVMFENINGATLPTGIKIAIRYIMLVLSISIITIAAVLVKRRSRLDK